MDEKKLIENQRVRDLIKAPKSKYPYIIENWNNFIQNLLAGWVNSRHKVKIKHNELLSIIIIFWQYKKYLKFCEYNNVIFYDYTPAHF